MTKTHRFAPYCSIGNCYVFTHSAGAAATPIRRVRRALRRIVPIAAVLAGLFGAGAGCDMLWMPYIQQSLLPDGASREDLGGRVDPSDLAVDGAPVRPATCAQARAQGNGMVLLYINNDPNKPWTALCALADGNIVEYLALPSATSNFAQYTAGGSAMGMNVRTTYSAIRIDPWTLKVNCGDQSHATKVGMLNHPNKPDPIPVTSMPYGVAAGCDRIANGVGQIDLRGTPFAVLPDAFVTYGNDSIGTATYGADNRTVNLTGGGYCGWQNPRPGSNNPLNADTSVALQLVYSPM